MPVISNPEPMPVDVIVEPALGLEPDVELPEVVCVGVLVLLVGEMTELIVLIRALGC
jgi:hypothetical protein